MEGEAKRDYPASILHQSGWYPDYETVETYFSRMQAVMTQGQADCDILVLNPVESAWAQIYAGWATWLTSISPEVQALDRQYRDMFHWLSGAQLDFDLGDEDIMHRHGEVLVKDGQALLRVGEASYTTVVVSGMETIRGTTLDLLETFVAKGGRVIVAGTAPTHADAIASDRPAALAASGTAIPLEQTAMVEACAKAGRPVSVTAAKDGTPLNEIFCQSRTDGALRYVLALNINRGKGFDNCKVRIQGDGTVEEWDCLRGTRNRIDAKAENGYLSFVTDFPKAGEKLYVVTPASDPALPLKSVYTEVSRTPLAGPYAYSLDEPNICLLDRASYQVDGGDWQEAREILKVDRALRDTFELPQRGGEMLQPWFAGKTPSEVKAQVVLRFDFEVQDTPETLHLLMERPEFFEVLLNGTLIDSDSVDGWMIDTCLQRLPLPVAALKAAENVIELRVGFHEDLNLEALYLIGDFGVEVQETRRILTRLPEKLNAGDVTTQGLPFYSGRIQYQIPAQKSLDDARAFLNAAFEGACVKVYGKDTEAQMIPWAPYEAEITEMVDDTFTVEVVLTRRNTFGPHHQIPMRAGGYGPGNWHTSGERFTENYMLYPAGLLETPEIVWKKSGN